MTAAALVAAAGSRDDLKARELKRMQTIATGLLVVMAMVFVAASLADDRWPWLGYVRAFAEAGMVGQLLQGRGRRAVIDQPAKFGDAGCLAFSQWWLFGLATQAGAETGTFGCCGRRKKADVFRARRACRASGAAIDAGGGHGVEKFALRRRVASGESGPAWVVQGDAGLLAGMVRLHGDPL